MIMADIYKNTCSKSATPRIKQYFDILDILDNLDNLDNLDILDNLDTRRSSRTSQTSETASTQLQSFTSICTNYVYGHYTWSVANIALQCEQ